MKKNKNTLLSSVFLLFVSAFIIRIILANFGTLSLDQNTFISWGRTLATKGFSGFYNGWSDYLPGYLYVLSLLAKLEAILPIPATLLYKLPAIFGDLACGFLIFKLARKKLSEQRSLIIASLVLFNPAVLANSTFWGQVDVLTILFSLLSLFFLEGKKYSLSAISLAIGMLIKPQAVLAAPVIFWMLYQKKASLKSVAIFGAITSFIFGLAFVPFIQQESFVPFVVARLSQTLGQYPYGSVNAFNFWGLWGFWQTEGVGLLNNKTWGYILFLIINISVFLKFKKVAYSHYLFLAVLLLTNFLFFTRMHERHLLPGLIALVPLVTFNWIFVIPLSLFSLTYVLNMRYAYIWIVEQFKEIFSPPLVIAFILVNLLALLIAIHPEVVERILSRVKKTKVQSIVSYIKGFFFSENKPVFTFTPVVSVKKGRQLLFGILAFALVTRLVSLSAPSNEYFDEVYHAFTARQIYNGSPKAWEWWNESPEGFAYEWTHPPFAKLIMIVGMGVFGENSFGWRVPAAVFGVGTVFLVYAITKRLFKSEEVSLLAASIYSLDGLALVMSRIGMNDIYVVFFILLSLYGVLSSRILKSAAALGLAASAKWSTLWFIPVLIASAFLSNKRVTKTYFWFLLLPPIIYLASYFPLFLTGHSFDIFWGMQKQMWWYHTGLVATHPFSSDWWSWPLLLRPIWLYTSGEANGLIGNIYAMGNPIVFWGGIVGVLSAIYYSFVDRNKNLLIVVGAYLGLFMPWAFSPRIMFLYHYFPAVPFMCIALAYVLMRNKKLIKPFLILSLVVFIYFYPRLTGIQIPMWLNDSYYWLPSWR